MVESEYPIPSQRLKLVSPVAGSTYKNSTQVQARCRLTGITFFIDSPDSGDYVNVSVGGRVVVDRLNIDVLANTSYDVGFSQEAKPGDLIETSLFSADGTSKTLTWTAKAVILTPASSS